MREIGATVQLHLISGYKSGSIELHLWVQLGETGATMSIKEEKNESIIFRRDRLL